MQNKMTEGNVIRALAAFTVPLILSGLFQQLFNWVDAFIVGNVEGETALAGIGATTSVYNLFVTVITGFTSGLSVLAAQRYGMGEKSKIRELLSSYTVLFAFLFTMLSIAGAVFTEELLVVLDTPETILFSAQSYLKILFAGIPFLAVYNTYSAVLRGIGNSSAPFFSILVCSAVNVVLDLLFVAGMGYGAAGAAAATAISQAAMAVYVIVYTVRKYPFLRFSFSGNLPDKTVWKSGAAYGLPSAVQSGVSSAGNIYLQQFMNGFGEQTVAAITTAYRVDTVIFLPIINFGSGIATVVAQNIGAGKPERAKQVFRAISRFYMIYGISMAVRGCLEGRGDMLFSGIAGILSLGVRILCSYAFKPVFGNMVVAYAEAFSWIFLLAVLLLRYVVKTR
ncbi:MAG TPA: MATE family efflux transporter [Candidatus Mediterraneibacter merdigallinarum]|nr:MATE family efflux transporter [Candidatus Mediterraneibacter merdigallinarum]